MKNIFTKIKENIGLVNISPLQRIGIGMAITSQQHRWYKQLRIFTSCLNQVNNISDILLHSMSVLLCRDKVIIIPIISLHSLYRTDITHSYIYFIFWKILLISCNIILYIQIDNQIDKQVDKQMDIDGWMDGRKDGQTDR